LRRVESDSRFEATIAIADAPDRVEGQAGRRRGKLSPDGQPFGLAVPLLSCPFVKLEAR